MKLLNDIVNDTVGCVFKKLLKFFFFLHSLLEGGGRASQDRDQNLKRLFEVLRTYLKNYGKFIIRFVTTTFGCVITSYALTFIIWIWGFIKILRQIFDVKAQ